MEWNSSGWASVKAVEPELPAAATDFCFEAVRQLAQEFGVFAQNAQGSLSCGAGESQIGFSIELCGRHASEMAETPGCPECEHLRHALRAIASHVLPGRTRACRQQGRCVHEIRSSHTVAPPHNARLTLSLIHSTEFFANQENGPPFFQQLRERLKQLGIEERVGFGAERWKS